MQVSDILGEDLFSRQEDSFKRTIFEVLELPGTEFTDEAFDAAIGAYMQTVFSLIQAQDMHVLNLSDTDAEMLFF